MRTGATVRRHLPEPYPALERIVSKQTPLDGGAAACGQATKLRFETLALDMPEVSPNVDTLLRLLPKPRLVDLGRQFGVAIAKPNGVPKEESVARVRGSGQLVFRELVEWMRCDELRQACRELGVAPRGRTRAVLSEALLRAHGAASVQGGAGEPAANDRAPPAR